MKMSQQKLAEVLAKLCRIYVDVFGESIVKIMLYGSYARQAEDDESDIDVVAIVRGNRDTLQQQTRKVWDRANDLDLEYDVVISPTVLPYDEFEYFKNAMPYYMNIEKEGIEIGA